MLGNLERRIVPADVGASGRDFIRAQRSAVHVVRAFLIGGSCSNNRLAADQGGPVGLGLGGLDGGIDGLRIVALHIADHVPAVGFEALGGVVGVPAVDMAVDGVVVVIPEGDQLAQAPSAGQRASLVGDAFHHAAVAHKYISMVIDDFVAGLVEFVCQQLFGHGHADRVRNPLAQRAGRGFHAHGVTIFRMARGLGVHLAEALDFFHRQVIAREMQQGVDQHGAVAVGLHETVAVEPLRVRGVVAQMVVPQDLGDFRHAHGRAGMAGIGLLHGVHRQGADCARCVIVLRWIYLTSHSHVHLPPETLRE